MIWYTGTLFRNEQKQRLYWLLLASCRNIQKSMSNAWLVDCVPIVSKWSKILDVVKTHVIWSTRQCQIYTVQLMQVCRFTCQLFGNDGEQCLLEVDVIFFRLFDQLTEVDFLVSSLPLWKPASFPHFFTSQVVEPKQWEESSGGISKFERDLGKRERESEKHTHIIIKIYYV